ncbi:hypothetical protein [Chromobacterium haemolyticum]|uniref:hypothetical protein n=1 Tax=Chromobacterium haemolyticum TaxID=394935 RepID=UPI00244C1FAB|nr:hypothetical protein [Chromobacterium haemolyticum]MDH0343778.1 hypothetical protein [Chromobacterium haemolyticum]
MEIVRIKIPRTSDVIVADVFKEFGARFEIAHANVTTLAFCNIGQVALSEEAEGEWKALLSCDSYLISMMSCQVAGLNVSYARGGGDSSPIFDEILINPQRNGSSSVEQKFNVISFLSKKLNSFEPHRFIEGVVSEEQAQVFAIHTGTLSRLEKLNEDLVRQSSDFRRGLEEKFEHKVTQLEQEHFEKQKRLESDGRALSDQLEAKEQALNEKLKTIDDRNNTHVRRETRDRILDDVKKRISQFGVSKATAGKRKPVLGGICILLLAFIGLLLWTGYEIKAMDSQYFSMLEAIRNISSWGPERIKSVGLSADTVAKVSAVDVDRTHLFWLWGRFALFSFGLVGTILYYIKWENRWAEQHIVSEFQLQQFYIDVNRANWVIESCLEWRKETGSAIPRELLGSITAGLFMSNQIEPERVIHPADELASALLGTASKLKLKVGDNEIDFDKPSKIARETIKVGSPSKV